MTKKIFTVTGVFFGMVFLLLMILQLWLFTDHARLFVQKGVNDSIPGQVSCDTFSFSILSGSLDLGNILIKGPDDETIISADRAFADISWLSLIKNEVAIEKLSLESPDVWLQLDQTGNLNLLAAFTGPGDIESDIESESSSGGFPANICIDEGVITGGIFKFTMSGTTETYDFRNIELDLTKGNLLEQSGHFLIKTGESFIVMPDIDASINGLKLEGELEDGMLNLISFMVHADDLTLDLTGKVEDTFSSPVFDLNAKLESSLNKFREIFKISTELTGPVKLNLAASGKADNPDAFLTLDYGGGTIAGRPFEKIHLKCSLSDRQLVIKDADTITPAGKLNLTGMVNFRNAFSQGFLSQEQDFDAISYDVFLKQSHAGLKDLLGEKAGVGGSLSSRLHLEGRGVTSETVALNAKLDMTVKDFLYEDVLAPMEVHLASQLRYEKGGVLIEYMDLSTGDLHLLVNGKYDLASDDINAMLKLNAPEMSRLKWASGIGGVTGQLELSAGISGKLKQPVIDMRLQGDYLGFKEVKIDSVLCSTLLDQNGALNILNLQIKNKGTVLEGKGHIKIFDSDFKLNRNLPGDIAVTFQNLVVEDILKNQPVSGQLSGSFAYKGTVDDPEVSLLVKGNSLGIKDRFSTAMDASLQFKKGKLIIDKAGLMDGDSFIDISGSMDLMNHDTGELLNDPHFDVAFTGTSVFLEDFLEEMKGHLTLSGNVNGSIKNPRGTLSIVGKDIETDFQTVHDARVTLSLDGEDVSIDQCVITLKPGEQISAEGWVKLFKHEYDFKVLSDPISLDSIEFIRGAVSLNGKLALDVSGKGNLGNPDIDGRIKAIDLHYGENKFDDFYLDIRLKNKLMSVAGNLGFEIGAWFNIDSMDFTAKADFNETSLRPMLEILGRKDLSGVLTGGVEAEGNGQKPEMIRAIVDIKDFTIIQDEVELIRSEAFYALLENKAITVPGFRLNLLDKGRLEFSGKGNLDGSVDFLANGNIPLEVLRIYAEEYTDMTGDIDFSGVIGGTIDQPVIRSDINFYDIELTVPDLMQKLHSVNGHIEVTPRAVSIDHFRGMLDKGAFELSGRVNLDKYKPKDFAVKIHANVLPINIPETMEVLLNTDVKIAGTAESSVIEGDIVILEGRYYKDVKLNLVDSVRRRTRDYTPTQKEIIVPFLKDPKLKINVRHRSPFDIDNNLALMTLRPNLHIHGTLNKPLISGRAEVESGLIIYQNKDFQITKGVVDFINPYKVEPTIELTGQVDIRQWMIFLEVSGTPENLEFKLTSDPYEGHWDILSLIVFGKTTNELGESGGGTTVSTTQILADMVSQSLQENIKDATGVDSVEVRYSEGLEEGDPGDIKITVGKELSDRMSFIYGVETKDGAAVQSATTEYKFLEKLLVKTFQDTEGDFGGELVFRLEFR